MYGELFLFWLMFYIFDFHKFNTFLSEYEIQEIHMVVFLFFFLGSFWSVKSKVFCKER